MSGLLIVSLGFDACLYGSCLLGFGDYIFSTSLSAALVHSWLKADQMDQPPCEANWHPECSVLIRELKVRVYVKKHDDFEAMWQSMWFAADASWLAYSPRATGNQ